MNKIFKATAIASLPIAFGVGGYFAWKHNKVQPAQETVIKEEDFFRAPDITLTPLGQKFVRALAIGTYNFLVKNNLPMPTTEDEFENGFVRISIEKGAEGALPFFDEEARGELLKLIGLDPGLAKLDADKFNETLKNMAEKDPEVQRKVTLMTVLQTRNPIPTKERIKLIRENGGPEWEPIVKAFQMHDCQRRLVFKALQGISKERQKSD